MEFFGLLGEKLGHSLSAPIHQAVFEKMHLLGAYKLIEVPREKLSGVGEAMRLLSLRGLNVTIPYKETIIPQLDEITPFARAVGAVNTIHNDGGRLVGHNTDVYGLCAMLERFALTPTSGPCAVLGSGGAAKAAVTALTHLGATEIYIATRDITKQKTKMGTAKFITYQQLETLQGDVLINATPVGMYPSSNACPVSDQTIGNFRCIADTIYNPSETMLYKAAKLKNKPACTGLYMLICQAIRAEEIWWNIAIPAAISEEIFHDLGKEF